MAGVTPAADGEARIASPRAAARLIGISGGGAAVFQGWTGRFAGIGLRPLDDSGGRCELCLLAATGPVTIAELAGEDAVAQWRDVARHSGLPLVIMHPDRHLELIRPQLGPLPVGPVWMRRRSGSLAGRRPRFLTRRKTARLPLRPVVYRMR